MLLKSTVSNSNSTIVEVCDFHAGCSIAVSNKALSVSDIQINIH